MEYFNVLNLENRAVVMIYAGLSPSLIAQVVFFAKCTNIQPKEVLVLGFEIFTRVPQIRVLGFIFISCIVSYS